MIRLSPHFTLEELTGSQLAARRGIDNRPRGEVLGALGQTALAMEKVRDLLGGRVISVSSGYRSPLLNLAIGGSRRSAHMTGHAVDFNCFGFGPPSSVCQALATSDLAFDQLIDEGAWTHISFAPALRGEVLSKSPGGGYRPGLIVQTERKQQ